SREGFVDISAIFRNQTVSEKQEDQIAWIMAVNRKENYLWFSLKNRNQLPATVLWMENRGRHHAPWCGRNSCIGIEETCSFFASGRKQSIIHNHINSRGIKTAVQFNPEKEISVRTIQGVTDYDMSNGSIRNVQFSDHKMVITTDTDHKIEVAVSWKFLCSDL
ncbi:MAG: hypothetical protein JRJ45_08750, partial [Deltaproteobacteria bacterium]|nr:hypothetical protein [Deltaproteobacteria bacterium]